MSGISRFTPEEKAEIVLLALRTPEKVSEICREKGVSPVTYNKWKRKYITGGKLRSNDPLRQEESLLALTLLMFSIIFYNVERYGKKMKEARSPTPVIWDNIQVLGKYQFQKRLISKGSMTGKGLKKE